MNDLPEVEVLHTPILLQTYPQPIGLAFTPLTSSMVSSPTQPTKGFESAGLLTIGSRSVGLIDQADRC